MLGYVRQEWADQELGAAYGDRTGLVAHPIWWMVHLLRVVFVCREPAVSGHDQFEPPVGLDCVPSAERSSHFDDVVELGSSNLEKPFFVISG